MHEVTQESASQMGALPVHGAADEQVHPNMIRIPGAPNYCRRYRPAARHPEPVDTSTSHAGFRCVVGVAES
jgi:formylglycine-generating enzyme required for sulfatase activity